METLQAEPVADGQQQITSADVVCKVLCIHQGKAPSQGSGNNLFFEECWYPDKLYQNRDIGGENALGTTCC
jgi:hypothetical protein